MKKKIILPLILITIFGVFLVPISLNSENNDHGDHDHEGEDNPHTSYIPCECGNPGCTGNVMTCPWSLGRPYPAPTVYCERTEEGGIFLSWTSSYGATSYKVFRSDSQSGTYTLIQTTSSSTYTYTDYPSVTGRYWYKVKASNDNGDSAYSYAVSCVTGPTSDFAHGFLYAQSSVSHSWSQGVWTDEYAAITSVENPGDYFVIYTASYKIKDNPPWGLAQGYGWVRLVTDYGVQVKSKRMYDCLQPFYGDDRCIYGSLIVADVVTLGTGGVKAQISFTPYIDDYMVLLDRSICAIPVESGFRYDNTMNYRVLDDESTFQDPDIHISDLTGTYFAIYTASFKVNDDTADYGGVHCNGWTFFATNTEDISYSKRTWEFPASFTEDEMRGTIIIADKLQLNNEDLFVKLRLDQREDEEMTIMERSLVLIPLQYYFEYEQRTNPSTDLNQDILFEDLNLRCFTMYTANYGLRDPDESDDPYTVDDQAQGWGWTAINNGINKIDYTVRYLEFPFGYGAWFWKTITHVEILDLQGKDMRIEYNWNPSDNELFTLYERSMIMIPFIPPLTIRITNPFNGATVSNSYCITASVTASVGVQKVEFYIDDVLKYTDSNGGDGWKYYWYSRIVDNGWHTITSKVYDDLGRTASDTHNVFVSNTYSGGGGGCPILSVYDGEQYIEEGLLDIHNPDGIDVLYEHELITQPVKVDNHFLLRLEEHPKTISHIDKVELWGELSNGRMIRLSLVSAIHSEAGEVRFLLWFSDDRKIDELGADHNNGISQSIDLRFIATKRVSFDKFLFVIEGNNMLVK